MSKKTTLGIIISNRDFFPDQLVTEARADILGLCKRLNIDPIIVNDTATKLGGVETHAEARKCADLFRAHRDSIDGILVVLPNFGDEKGVADAIKLADLNVPILIQGYPDDLDQLIVSRRRDAYCGKISVCNNLHQAGIAYSVTQQHTIHPSDERFVRELEKFVAVCSVVNGMRTVRIGAVGARPGAFNTVRYSEKILERNGISVTTVDLSDILGRAEKLSGEDPTVRAKIEEIKSYADTGLVPPDKLTLMATMGVVLGEFMEENALNATAIQCWTSVQQNHGPLCSIYAALENGDFRSEGDSPAFLHTIVTGLRNMESPDWGGWGGRYVHVRENTWLDPVPVPGYSYPEGRWYGSNGWGRNSLRKNSKTTPEQRREYFKPMWRWTGALQNDFAARADWCVKSYENANHPPVVVLNHAANLMARPGQTVNLSTKGTVDPDGDELHYRWWQYEEADTYLGSVEIEGVEKQNASFKVPSDASHAKTIHVICEVTDVGSPPLTRYQRVVVEIDNPRTTPAVARGFSVSNEAARVTVNYDGKLVAQYHFRDKEARKPYFWPVIGPTGKSMTRAFPMETVDGEQHDHPHHRGVWFGHQGVAGTDTWLEVASKNYEGEKQKKFLASLGSIVHTAFTEISANEDQAVIRSNNDYLDSSGKQLMADRRVMIFRISDGKLVVDFDITLLGTYGDVELQDKKDAGLNVRVPTSMSLADGKGHIVNSVGERDGDTWSKKAEWVDYHGPVDGDHLGIAFLNHPSSFRHPTRWHVRDYGLFTANAFGPQSLDATAESGTLTLNSGESLHLRHRIIFHEGDEKTAGIEEAYQAYAASDTAE